MLKRTSLTIMLIFLFCTFPALAADTPAKVKAAMDKAGLKVYPGAVYCTGQIDMGARFATSDSPEKVREWYRKEYPKWSVQEKYGSWAFLRRTARPGNAPNHEHAKHDHSVQRTVAGLALAAPGYDHRDSHGLAPVAPAGPELRSRVEAVTGHGSCNVI